MSTAGTPNIHKQKGLQFKQRPGQPRGTAVHVNKPRPSRHAKGVRRAQGEKRKRGSSLDSPSLSVGSPGTVKPAPRDPAVCRTTPADCQPCTLPKIASTSARLIARDLAFLRERLVRLQRVYRTQNTSDCANANGVNREDTPKSRAKRRRVSFDFSRNRIFGDNHPATQKSTILNSGARRLSPDATTMQLPAQKAAKTPSNTTTESTTDFFLPKWRLRIVDLGR